MKIIQCSNGHHYDAEKFSSCPHCADMAANGAAGPVINAPNVDQKVVRPIYNDTPTVGGVINVNPISADAPTGMFTNDDVTVELGHSNKETVALPKETADDVTVVHYATDSSTANAAGKSNAKKKGPVVGWLVVIEGPDFGKSFTLKTGKNFVGRSTEMDVVFNDQTVSRNKHAIIVFEPKQRLFIAQSGDASTLFYLNGNVVLSNEILKPYDKIQLGDTTAMFVPFCGEQFGWE